VGTSYSVNLRERPGKYWAWSYVLHDIDVSGKDGPIDDEVSAIAMGMAAASAHIDRVIAKP
jgi:hypothetical protein